MKHIILVILTILLFCGNVYSNPVIDTLDDEMDDLRPEIVNSIEDLKRFSKLREIKDSLLRRERDNKAIREWNEWKKEQPCTSMYRQACENGVRI